MAVPTTAILGRKIEGVRKLRRMTQEQLAHAVGLTQQAIDKIEQSDTIDDEKLKKIADALNVTVDQIRNFDENAAVQNSNNVFNDNSSLNTHMNCTFNPIDKLMELVADNKKLYEQLLAQKDEVIQAQKEMIEFYKKQIKLA